MPSYQQTPDGDGNAVEMAMFATNATPATDGVKPASIALFGVAVAGSMRSGTRVRARSAVAADVKCPL